MDTKISQCERAFAVKEAREERDFAKREPKGRARKKAEVFFAFAAKF
jgi:hypothetical protein